MTKLSRQLLFWSPRVISILFVLFISLFALDVFNDRLGFWQTCVVILIHLIPAGLLTVAIMISWHREWFLALLFIALGLYYLFTNLRHISWVLTISGPLLFIGVLYLLSWLFNKSSYYQGKNA